MLKACAADVWALVDNGSAASYRCFPGNYKTICTQRRAQKIAKDVSLARSAVECGNEMLMTICAFASYDDFISARAKGGLPDGRPSDEIGGRSSLM